MANTISSHGSAENLSELRIRWFDLQSIFHTRRHICSPRQRLGLAGNKKTLKAPDGFVIT